MNHTLPFIERTFTRKAGTTISSNPGFVLGFGNGAKADFFLDPNLPLDLRVAVQFHCKPKYNNNPEPPYPLIKTVKPTVDGGCLPVPRMKEKLLPHTFIQDLYSSSEFHFLAIFGAEENDFIPTFNVEEFWPVRDNILTWTLLASILLRKYKNLATQEGLSEEKRKVYERFANRLAKNSNSKDARVLIYGAGWGIQGVPLAQQLIPTAQCTFYMLSMAHPLTTKDNVQSMNPALTGSVSEPFTETRYFYTSQVNLGEQDILGETNFEFQHNRTCFIISKIRLRAPGKGSENKDMFHPLVNFDPMHYVLPEVKETGSEV